MEKVQEKIYAARRLLAEQRQRQLTLQRAKRNPERFKRILPAEAVRRGPRGIR